MSQTIATLRPFLTLFASATGAGAFAFYLIERLRAVYPQTDAVIVWPVARFCYSLLYAPRYTRLFALALAGLVSLSASVALSWMQGADVLAAADQALAASLGAVVSQFIHAFCLSSQLPAARQADWDAQIQRIFQKDE